MSPYWGIARAGCGPARPRSCCPRLPRPGLGGPQPGVIGQPMLRVVRLHPRELGPGRLPASPSWQATSLWLERARACVRVARAGGLLGRATAGRRGTARVIPHRLGLVNLGGHSTAGRGAPGTWLQPQRRLEASFDGGRTAPSPGQPVLWTALPRRLTAFCPAGQGRADSSSPNATLGQIRRVFRRLGHGDLPPRWRPRWRRRLHCLRGRPGILRRKSSPSRRLAAMSRSRLMPPPMGAVSALGMGAGTTRASQV